MPASRRDGCHTVSRGGITRRLYLRGGMIVYGTSTERQDRLGEILIAQGKLSREDHRAYWEISRSEGRRLGQTLVVTGRITPHDLYQGVTAQVVTILERLQKWRSGEYAFEEGADPEPGTALLCIPLALFLRAERPLLAGRGTTPAEPGAPAKRGGKRGGRAKAAAAPRAAAAPEDEEEITILAEEGAIAVPSRQEAEEQVRLGEVSFLVQELRSRLDQGPRALLGVPPDAPRAAVRQAFERIARVLRAERVPARAPAELAREAAELLRTAAAAAEAVEAEAKAPPAPAATPRAAPSAEEQARRLFAQGREFVARRYPGRSARALPQVGPR